MITKDDFFGEDSVKIPDLAEPITVYRSWNVDMASDEVIGFNSTPWPKDHALEAEHKTFLNSFTSRFGFYHNTIGPEDIRKCEETPNKPGEGGSHNGYGCGIYGFKTLELLIKNIDPIKIHGTVQLGGTVYEHRDGYRASYGLITGFYESYEYPEQVRRLAEAYQVPVWRTTTELIAALDRYHSRFNCRIISQQGMIQTHHMPNQNLFYQNFSDAWDTSTKNPYKPNANPLTVEINLRIMESMKKDFLKASDKITPKNKMTIEECMAIFEKYSNPKGP